jgi:uncharacterized protein YciI
MKIWPVCILLLATQLSFGQQKQYSIVFLNKKTDSEKISPEETKRIMDGHMANMGRLSDEGKLLAAGPFDGGGGIFIMNSASVKEVEEWISTDPGVQARRWNIEILPYVPRHGGICPVGENYTMVHYSFVRFDAVVSKFTASNQGNLLAEHDNYLRQIIKTGNVVTEAVFGETDGGILIVKGEIDPALVQGDPAVRDGLIEPQMKKLYIARGSFCEE